VEPANAAVGNKATAADTQHFRSCVGQLLYITALTAPELGVVTSLLSQHIKSPPTKCLKVLKRVARYLIGRKKIPFTIRKDSRNHINSGQLNATVYPWDNCVIAGSDATWNNYPDSTFQYGFVVMIMGNVVAFKSKKAKIQALSTFEAETIAMSEATREVLYFRNLLEELGFPQGQPSVIYTDNTACLAHAKDRKQTERSKHVRLKYWFHRSATERGETQPEHMDTRLLSPDATTKPLKKLDFLKHRATLLNMRG